MYFLEVNKIIKQTKNNMKKLLNPILILLLSIATAFILKPSNNNEIQNIKLRQKQFEETYNKQMTSIKQKQDELIQIYDFIISNKTNQISFG